MDIKGTTAMGLPSSSTLIPIRRMTWACRKSFIKSASRRNRSTTSDSSALSGIRFGPVNNNPVFSNTNNITIDIPKRIQRGQHINRPFPILRERVRCAFLCLYLTSNSISIYKKFVSKITVIWRYLHSHISLKVIWAHNLAVIAETSTPAPPHSTQVTTTHPKTECAETASPGTRSRGETQRSDMDEKAPGYQPQKWPLGDMPH